MLWKCGQCGCLGIAGSLTRCPMCGKERDMPKAPAGAAPSNANAVPGEVGHIPAEVLTPDQAEPPETGDSAAEGDQAEVSDPEIPAPEGQEPSPEDEATELASLAKEAFNENDYAKALEFLTKAGEKDPSRQSRWDKLIATVKDAAGSSEDWNEPQDVEASGGVTLPSPGAGNG